MVCLPWLLPALGEHPQLCQPERVCERGGRLSEQHLDGPYPQFLGWLEVGSNVVKEDCFFSFHSQLVESDRINEWVRFSEAYHTRLYHLMEKVK